MIICFDKNTKKIISISNGENPIPTYNDNNNSICVENCNYIFKKGDSVFFHDDDDDDDNEYVTIGTNTIKLVKSKYTVITEKNCNKPIILEEL